VSGEGRGDSEAVYLVRGAGWSFSFVEPHTRDRPKKPDEPAPRHAPRNVDNRLFGAGSILSLSSHEPDRPNRQWDQIDEIPATRWEMGLGTI